MDPVNIVNIALCIIILILGYLGYKQNGNKAPLLIGIAFGLFGISHILKLFGLEVTLLNVIIVMRVIAYLMVVLALWIFAAKR